MAKKKASSKQPTSKQPRPKRLRLVSTAPIGLSPQEQQTLRDLYRPLGHLSGLSISIDDRQGQRRLALDRLLYIYIEALCHDATLENANLKKRRTVSLRRSVFADMSKLCGRELSPTDIVKELAKHAPVPEFAASAIRRDYLAISIP